MNRDNFYILHLSDLHIQNALADPPYYQNALKKLLDDIKNQTSSLENIVVVVSGDIIDKGDYAKSEKAAICFFENLYENLKTKVIDIIIVPGNHDKKREPIDALISKAHSDLGINDTSSNSETEWTYHLKAYDSFISLVNRIYAIFGKKKNINNTFGLDVVSVNNATVCFISMDTAWCSHSHSKCGDLRIGEYQLSKLFHDYQDVCNKYEGEKSPIDLTIAISHYPMNWINPKEKELCNQYFLSNNFLNVDILMCGHVHDFSVINYFNHEHSLLTLVTGIGWNKEKPDEDKSSHRYSIYSMNLSYNSCDIVVRKTKNLNAYDYDYSLYVEKQEFEDKKLRYPLKIKQNNAFIRVNTPTATSSKSLFLNNEIVSSIPKVSGVISSFSDRIARLYTTYKDNCFSSFEEKLLTNISETAESTEEQTTLNSLIYEYLYYGGKLNTDLKDKYLKYETAFDDFLSFLSEICTYSAEEIKECFSTNVQVRTHFRWHVHEEEGGKTTVDEYSMLCKSPCIDEQETEMKSICWGSLIKPAFETSEPIVYSANKKFNSVQTEWNDFITLIPQFSNFSHDIRVRKGKNESRPIITFGLSIKGDITSQDTLALHLLAYLRLDKVIARMIDDYIDLFNIDTRTFLGQIREIKNKTINEVHI